jgi:Flp pilus assembly pilin Flp
VRPLGLSAKEEEMTTKFSFRIFPEIQKSFRTHDGQALVEYALILMLVALVCVGALQLIGTNVNNALNAIAGL